MGKLTRYQGIPDQGYDARVTDMSLPLRAPRGRINPDTGRVPPQWRNLNVANTTPIQLVTNAASIRVLPNNARRSGLLIQNKDTTADLFIGFGLQADLNAFLVPAKGSILLDFTCPNSEVYAFAIANIQCVFIEMTRGY